MVLNPALYASLKVLNRGKDPQVCNAGMPARFTVSTRNGKAHLHGEGEQYAIDCPACNDTRGRLYVHHSFGQVLHVLGFNQPGDQLLCLAYCQNEQKRIRLAGYLEGYTRSAKDSAQGTLAFLNSQSSVPLPPPVCPPMGLCIPLHEADPGDMAILYLKKRGFNVEYLGRAAGAVLMIHHPDGDISRMTRGRIGFPFFVDGELKTWQARLPYDLEKGKKWPPKWWFPGGAGTKVPWNVDVASQFQVVIITEGILSAVNMGPAAISIGGKTLTNACMDIVKKKWKRAFVALDPDAGINRKPGTIDFHKRALSQLAEVGIEATGAAWTAGDDRDPGDLSPQECMQLIRRSDPMVAAALPYVGLAA